MTVTEEARVTAAGLGDRETLVSTGAPVAGRSGSLRNGVALGLGRISSLNNSHCTGNSPNPCLPIGVILSKLLIVRFGLLVDAFPSHPT